MGAKDSLSPVAREQVNKRLTLNFLIQGAAGHLMLTAHHAMKSELDLLDERLLPAYDRFIAAAYLGYWRGSIRLLFGKPKKFWRAAVKPDHPFHFHPFFRKHGLDLALASKEDIFQRCREKNIWRSGFVNEFTLPKQYLALQKLEAPHALEVISLQTTLCSMILGISEDKLRPELTNSPHWGVVREPKTWRGKVIKSTMIGWGGVHNNDGILTVIAKAAVGPLVFHELVKGSVELICLHGLSDLSPEMYTVVMDETEHIEYEIPMLRTGPEFYRRFLAVLPREIPLAQNIMNVSQMQPRDLDQFLFQMIESPNRATDMLRIADSD